MRETQPHDLRKTKIHHPVCREATQVATLMKMDKIKPHEELLAGAFQSGDGLGVQLYLYYTDTHSWTPQLVTGNITCQPATSLVH